MRLTIALPYYRNAAMLAAQYAAWGAYPDAIKPAIEIVLVDDGSPEPAIDVPRPDGLPALRLYRVLEDRPWHQHGARNLAAREASGEWMLMTDMDHVLPAGSAAALLDVLEDAGDLAFTFARVDAPHGRPKLDAYGQPHPHPNTFAVRRETFWRVGGYDEDCVGYGTDGFFRQRLFEAVATTHLEAVPVWRYPREVITDASTQAPSGVDPKVFRDRARRTEQNRRMLSAKAAAGRGPTVLSFPWERVL